MMTALSRAEGPARDSGVRAPRPLSAPVDTSRPKVRVCVLVEWWGDRRFVPRGGRQSWKAVVEGRGVAAIRRVGEVSVGEFSAVYEVDVVDGYTRRRTTSQYLVGDGDLTWVARSASPVEGILTSPPALRLRRLPTGRTVRVTYVTAARPRGTGNTPSLMGRGTGQAESQSRP